MQLKILFHLNFPQVKIRGARNFYYRHICLFLLLTKKEKNEVKFIPQFRLNSMLKF
jgi:hypothetical protein